MSDVRLSTNALSVEHLSEASAYVEYIWRATHGKVLPATPRIGAAASCFAIVQDHHHAIVLLLSSRLYASCFALLRVAFEAYVRGEWLWTCATDLEVEAVLAGKEPPKVKVMMDALVQQNEFVGRSLVGIHMSHWKALCGYTHTGGIHLQRWIASGSIEPCYSTDELLEAIRFVDVLAAVSAAGVLSLAGELDAAEQLLLDFRAREAR